jgi:hypothetical protein
MAIVGYLARRFNIIFLSMLLTLKPQHCCYYTMLEIRSKQEISNFPNKKKTQEHFKVPNSLLKTQLFKQ